MAKLTPTAFGFSEVLIEAFRLNGVALAAGDRLTAPLGLTSARWQVMGAIGDSPAPVAHVARLMGLTRQSVRETADALVRAGFLTYLENPHHRTAKLLALTAAGQRVLRRVESRHVEWANRIGRRLELRALTEAITELRHVRDELERDGERAAPRSTVTVAPRATKLRKRKASP
jgi:DNA-binding MarR family transcriptional regulator